jgi:outer membrane protein assembly factor BamB
MSVFRPLLFLALLTLGGCSMFSSDDDINSREPAELEKIETQVKIKKLWSTGVGAGQGETFNRLTPVIADDVLYVAGHKGRVTALTLEKGRKVWSTDLDRPISGGVGFGAAHVLVGSSNGKVILLDAADGEIKWESDVRGEVLAAPQTNGEVVIVQTYDGKLRALDFLDGSEQWVYDSNLPVLTLRGTSTPIIFERMVIAAFANGRVYAFDLSTGAVRWEARVAIAQGRSEIERIVDIDGSMTIVGTNVYAVSYQGRLVAIELQSGRKLWQQEASSYAGLGQGFGNIYVSDESGSVIAFHRSGQGIRWEQSALEYRQLSTPTAVRGFVAVGDFEGYVHFLSQTDGEFVGRIKVDGNGVRANMLIHENILFVLGNGGKMMALDVRQKEK